MSFLALLTPPPPSTQIEGALSGIEESVHATPTTLEGKDASAEQSVEGPEAQAQPSMATPTEEDTHPNLLIRVEWHKVPDGDPKDASGQLEHDQLFINELARLGSFALLVSLTSVVVRSPSPATQNLT